MKLIYHVAFLTYFLSIFSSISIAQSDPTSSDGVDTAIATTPMINSPVKLSYEQAVEEGLHNNLDLLAAKYNIPMAEADELTAGLWNNPSLLADTIFEPFGHNWNQTSAGGPRQFDFGLSYPVDVSGTIPAAHKSAHEATNMAQLTFQDTIRQTLLNIRLAYINVMTDQQQLTLSQEQEDFLTDLVNVVKNRIGGSSRLPLEELRAQLALDQAKLNRRQAEITLRAARTALAVIIGRHEETPIETTTGLRDFKIPPPPPVDSLIAQALIDRPDLKALKVAIKKANLDKNLASAQIWSGVVVTGQYSTQGPVSANPDGASPSIPRGNSWDASITVPLPIFNRNQGNIHKADLTAEQIQKQVESLQLDISQQITGDYDQLILNRGLIIDYEQDQLANARRVRDENQKQVGMGNDTLVDYFDALNAYTQIVSAYYSAVAAYRSSVAQLDADCAKEVLP